MAKTDVIFLGAGASLSAGFPTNAALAEYIVYKLPESHLFGMPRGVPLPPPPDLFLRHREEWKHIANMLRKSNLLSVDEFCQLASSNADLVAATKRALRLALIDHSGKWWHPNDYRRLIDTLFVERASHELDDCFTIVNFNYDGLLGKLLTDAVRARCDLAIKQLPAPERMAAIGGGYGVNSISQPVTDGLTVADRCEPEKFCHHMPHGNATVARESRRLLSIQSLVYSHENDPDIGAHFEHREEHLAQLHRTEPLIHFPWEPDSREDVHKAQYEHAAISVKEAKRIHFIGMSGHPLLQQSLRQCFRLLTDARQFTEKHWHVATADKDHQRTWGRLMNCFLPEERIRDSRFWAGLYSSTARVHYFPTFEEWLNVSPHLQDRSRPEPEAR